MRTPWGTAGYVANVAEGIVSVSTPSHGGYHLDAKRNKLVPDYMRQRGGWYEEDCEWAIVATVFPQYFDEKQLAFAASSLKNYSPDMFEEFYEVPVTPEESLTRREEEFKKANVNNWVCCSACGDWHDGVPKGMVLVTASIGDTRENCAYFLVTAEEYDAKRKGCSFVVDPAKHQRFSPNVSLNAS